MASIWYYLGEALDEDYKTDTRYSEEDIVKGFKCGKLDGMTLIKKEGQEEFVELGSVQELLNRIRSGGKKRRSRKYGKTPPAVLVENVSPDITADELATEFRRGGVVAINPETAKAFVKLLIDPLTKKRLDKAVVVYVKPESIELACKYLNPTWIRNIKLTVRRATDDEAVTEDYLKPYEEDVEQLNDEILKKRRIAAKMEEQRLLSWNEDTSSFANPTNKKATSILVLKPCWTTEHAELYGDDSHFYEYIKDIIGMRLQKLQANVKSVFPITRHPLGVVSIKMKNEGEAESLVMLLESTDDIPSLSPLSNHSDHEHTQFSLSFYDGISDLKAQSIQVPAQYPQPTDLHTSDRLWLIRCGCVFKEQSNDENPTSPAQNDDARKLQEFGDWLEEQSSDEEFEVKTSLQS